jgi:hypothetical protein
MHSALRSRGGSLARILSPPQGLREEGLFREGVNRWVPTGLDEVV